MSFHSLDICYEHCKKIPPTVHTYIYPNIQNKHNWLWNIVCCVVIPNVVLLTSDIGAD